MNGPDRYRTIRGKSSASGDGTQFGSLEGLDPVTGLPVLIYEFEGEPLAGPTDLDSDNILRILWSGSEQGRGRLVAALTTGWRRLDDISPPLTPAMLLDAARALRDAARAGVAHGDLRPQRLLLAGDRLVIEGYGVPWTPSDGPYRAPEVDRAGTPAGDVWSLAAIVVQLGLSASDETLSAVIEQCSAIDPQERPSPDELYLALEALASQQEGPAVGRPQPSPRADSSPPAEEAATAAPASHAAGSAPPQSRAQPDEAAIDRQERSSTGDPGGTRPERSATGDPAAARAADAPEEPGEKRRRLALLGALMTAVVILALLAVYGPRTSEPPAAATLEDTIYVVEVDVSPADLPPVNIHLVSSPEGSSLAQGDSLGTAPRHLALDRPGKWAFQGSLQDRRSEVVEIEVPEERTISLVIPP